ncbi:nbl1 borealin [Ceratocystis lukuohia]|uniref:Nbl1 borealin n=1 Tax=Ceratocystis lukuohia TaxID=2019550 RepID=A0ABR4MAM2_9PEZI
MSLRKLTMAELVQRHVQQQERSAQIAAKIAAGMTKSTVAPIARPGMKAVPSLAAPTQTTRRFKRTSNAMLGGDKENDNGSSDPMEYPKKRARAVPANASETGPVLSPTSSNSRLVPRSWQQSPTKASPIKVPVSRAASPVKTSRANLLSNMVEKAKTTRAAMTRKATTASVTSTASSTASTTASSRTKRTAASKQAAAPATATRVTRRTSGDSNSSSSTVVKKTSSRPGTAMSKSSTTSRGKAASGTATKKTAASKASAAKDAPKRVLRSRAA